MSGPINHAKAARPSDGVQRPCVEDLRDTVDARNPSEAVEVGSLPPLFTGFYTSQGGCLGFLPSTVDMENLRLFIRALGISGASPDFFHQQYVNTLRSHPQQQRWFPFVDLAFCCSGKKWHSYSSYPFSTTHTSRLYKVGREHAS